MVGKEYLNQSEQTDISTMASKVPDGLVEVGFSSARVSLASRRVLIFMNFSSGPVRSTETSPQSAERELQKELWGSGRVYSRVRLWLSESTGCFACWLCAWKRQWLDVVEENVVQGVKGNSRAK